MYVTSKMCAVAHGNKGVICAADFIQPMLPDEHVEDFLPEFENVASIKVWPRDHWAELLQPFLTAKFLEVYSLMGHDRDNYDRYNAEIQSGESWESSAGSVWFPMVTIEEISSGWWSCSEEVAHYPHKEGWVV